VSTVWVRPSSASLEQEEEASLEDAESAEREGMLISSCRRIGTGGAAKANLLDMGTIDRR
jgi:hypothetical protein